MQKFAFAAALALSFGAAATPALAAPSRAPASAIAASATVTDTVQQAPRAQSQRYCVVAQTTGSRIPRKTCQTRDAWLAQGFDPIAAR